LTGGDEGEGDQGHPHPASPIKGEVRGNAASFARGIYQMEARKDGRKPASFGEWMQQTTPAIILKKVAYGEADLIVTFFGREEGRLSGIAKHARASQKRFGGALELGSIVDLRYTSRYSSDLVRIEDANVTTPTVGILQSLGRIAAMSKALELALAFLPERQSASEKFDYLVQYITVLTKSEPTFTSALAFELKWLSYVGYQPALDGCMNCGGQGGLEGTWSFSISHGGIFCQKCVRPHFHRVHLKEKTLQGMRRLAHGQEALLDHDDHHSIKNILLHYVEHLLGRPLHGRIITDRW